MVDETKDSRERELLEAYVVARTKREMLEAQSTSAYKEMETAKNKLVDYLQDMNKKSTGSYADLGSVLITEPMPSVKVPEEKKAEQMIYVRNIGAGACIKEQIHHATFSSLIRERLDKGESIPEFVEITYISQVKYSKPKATSAE